MRHGLWFAALTCVAAASAAQASDYVRVQFAPAKEPALYLQFDRDTLRIATTAEGLATAQPVKASGTQRRKGSAVPEVANYENVTLPVLPRGAAEATASFQTIHFVPDKSAPKEVVPFAIIIGTFSISATSSGGDTWRYVSRVDAGPPEEEAAAVSPENAPVMVVGDLSQPALTIEPQVKGRNVGIAVTLWTGAPLKGKGAGGREFLMPVGAVNEVNSLQKNGKPARVHLDVIAPPGKTIKSEDGDLQKFGAGWSGPNYSVRVAKKGTYTAKATIETPAGTVSAKATFTVR